MVKAHKAPDMTITHKNKRLFYQSQFESLKWTAQNEEGGGRPERFLPVQHILDAWQHDPFFLYLWTNQQQQDPLNVFLRGPSYANCMECNKSEISKFIRWWIYNSRACTFKGNMKKISEDLWFVKTKSLAANSEVVSIRYSPAVTGIVTVITA